MRAHCKFRPGSLSLVAESSSKLVDEVAWILMADEPYLEHSLRSHDEETAQSRVSSAGITKNSDTRAELLLRLFLACYVTSLQLKEY